MTGNDGTHLQFMATATGDVQQPQLSDLLTEYRPLFVRIAHRKLAGRAHGGQDRSDVAHDVIATILEKIGTYRGASGTQAEFLAWALTILDNQVKTLRRRRANQQSALEPSIIGSISAASSGPPSTAMKLEASADLWNAMDRLPADYRDVILLYHFDDLSHGEVADLLDRSENATRQLFHRAKERLRQLLSLGKRMEQ